ncbi:hypothetical protein [Nocardiopsis sp. MG754419]|uniref:hypothetical protein n=1 Tax=Nocardiopsis sp. MG754419 TaxID=2259865 RepID=UPI001BA79C9A|nr:hypothetical protein [Nocardiopsis sp. MG754419]MBR8740913.1 hypothetical protein [Nocardiopsis sp. MG754419]
MTLPDDTLFPWATWIFILVTGGLIITSMVLRSRPDGGYARGQEFRDRLIDRAPYFSARRRRAAAAIRRRERVEDPGPGRLVYLLAWEHYWYTFNPWQPRGVGGPTVFLFVMAVAAALFGDDPILGLGMAVPASLLAGYTCFESTVLRRRALAAMETHRGHATEDDPTPAA